RIASVHEGREAGRTEKEPKNARSRRRIWTPPRAAGTPPPPPSGVRAALDAPAGRLVRAATRPGPGPPGRRPHRAAHRGGRAAHARVRPDPGARGAHRGHVASEPRLA